MEGFGEGQSPVEIEDRFMSARTPTEVLSVFRPGTPRVALVGGEGFRDSGRLGSSGKAPTQCLSAFGADGEFEA